MIVGKDSWQVLIFVSFLHVVFVSASPSGCFDAIITPVDYAIGPNATLQAPHNVTFIFQDAGYSFGWEATYLISGIPYMGSIWLNGSAIWSGSTVLFGQPSSCETNFLQQLPPFDFCVFQEGMAAYATGSLYAKFQGAYGQLAPASGFLGGETTPSSLFGLQSLLVREQPSCIFPPLRGACCDARCYPFDATGFQNYTTACQVVDNEAACTAIGATFGWLGPGTTCIDGSCVGACCCNQSSCVPFPTGVTPQACAGRCATAGQWGGASGYQSCDSETNATCSQCLTAWSEFPLTVPSPPQAYTIAPPPAPPVGVCYWAGCLPMATTDPDFMACFDFISQADCYSLHPGYTWEFQEVLPCFVRYNQPYCSDVATGGGTQACFDGVGWESAPALYAAFGGDAFFYGNLPADAEIGCEIPPPFPPGIACPACPGYVPPPPPPTPPPPSVTYALANVTGACCASNCHLTSGDVLGCQDLTRVACNSLGADYHYVADFSTCDDGISCTAGCCNNATAGNCSPGQLTWNQCVAASDVASPIVGGMWAGGGNPGQFVTCGSGGYCTAPSAACTIPSPPPTPPPSPTPPPPPAVRTGACVVAGARPADSFLCAEVAKEHCEDYENPYGSMAFLRRETTCARDTWGGCCCGSIGTPGLIGFCASSISATDCATVCNGNSSLRTGFFYGQGTVTNCASAFNGGCPDPFAIQPAGFDPCSWICFLPLACNGFGQCG